MRLSSPRFTYLKSILNTLFSQVQLVPTSNNLERLRKANLKIIGAYVKGVEFVTPYQHWDFTYESFKEVILSQTIRKYAYDHKIWDGTGSFTDQKDGYQQFIQEHWDGRIPLFEDRIREGFEEFRNSALDSKDLLLGEGVEKRKKVWTSTLRALPNIHSVSFRDYGLGTSDFSKDWPYTIRSHPHDRSHQEEICQSSIAPVGDAIFAAGIASLAKAANVKPQSLTVASAMTGHFGWEAIHGWDKLDLSKLRTFIFQPKVNEDLNGSGGSEAVAGRAADAVAAILKKGGPSIESFTYDSSLRCPMQWPGEEVVQLPNLKFLKLNGGSIWPRNMKAWFAEMPSLERFELLDNVLVRGPYTDWLYVFDAIRCHPRGIHVEFDQIAVNDAIEASLSYHTNDFERYLHMEEAENSWEDVERSLALYISGKIGYNTTLRKQLLDWNYDEDED